MQHLKMETSFHQIPARPQALLDVARLIQDQKLDQNEILRQIKSDVALYSTVLCAVNSALSLQGKKITSIELALKLLGIKRLSALVKVMVQRATQNPVKNLERFWDSAVEIATLTEYFSERFTNEDKNSAYSLGMLHDCGIPLMLEYNDSYREFMINTQSENAQQLNQQEIATFGYSHYTLGAQVAQQCYMPVQISNAIQMQPDYFAHLNSPNNALDSECNLLSCLILAKDISNAYRHYWRLESPSNTQVSITETVSSLACVLEYLGLPDIEYISLREDLIQTLVQDGQIDTV